MKLYAFFAAVLVLFFAISCKKETMRYAAYEYQQTFCSDPWSHADVDSVTLRRFVRYMDSIGVYVASASLDSVNAPQVCNGCFCKTGKVFRLSTFDEAEDDARLKSYNFVRQQ
jgi:hypothetical protein